MLNTIIPTCISAPALTMEAIVSDPMELVHHVLELLGLNASHLLGFGDFQIILLTDELCLCLPGSSQSLKLQFLITVQYIAQHHCTRTIDLGNDEGILLTLMLLGRFYFKNLVFWIRWVEYLSFMTYSYDAVLYF